MNFAAQHRQPMQVQQANAPYHLLADMQRELWLPALVCSSGITTQRLHDLPVWETALVAGQLPSKQHDFGDSAAFQALRPAIAELGLCELAQGSPAMAKQVLRALLWHLDRLIDRPVDEPRAQAIERMVADFRAAWSLERQGWDEVLALFKTLGELPNQRWDELQGRLNSREWTEAKRIGELLTHLKELTTFIERLGRANRLADMPPSNQPLPNPHAPRQRVAVQITTTLSDQPGEVQGIKRSADLARMLASEAAMVRHPQLRRLWQARFAEGQLLTYESQAVLTEVRLQPDAKRHTAAAPHSEPLGMGPIIICLDTSGSMRGAPENVAKACVLQTLRSAHAGGRACRLLAFGGAGELLEHELGLTPRGLNHFLDIIGQSFDGGTDVQTPLERSIALVQTQAMALADILIVSDGEFGVTPATLEQLQGCKTRLGLRVHTMLIGDRETMGLREVSDQIHWVRNWRRYATHAADAYGDGFSPVHSRSLTAEYFPNAMRRAPTDAENATDKPGFLTASGHLVAPSRSG
jgi:uncharacterized protein with von Willebrand factor type A (vWA) domain